MEKQHYDAIIIGFGKGGKTLAGALARRGQKVAMIEKSAAMYGGTCINIGCLPSKSMKTSAEKSAERGGDFADRKERYAAAVVERERLTAMLRAKNYHKLADQPNIRVYTADGSFTGPEEVKLTYPDGQTEILASKLIVINTGSTPRILKIPGLAESHYTYYSAALMAEEKLPARLIVIGGGYIGMEFASMYANFGSQVTVIQNTREFLPREDRSIAQAVLQRLQDLGVEILFETETEKIVDKAGYAELSLMSAAGSLTRQAEAVLIAAGRIPNTEGLNLGAAGIKTDERGAIMTDEHRQTSNPRVYAMGDVVGGLQFTYISLDDFRIVKSAILGDHQRTTLNRGEVPYSVFLDPPFSRLGLTEQQARDRGLAIKIGSLPTAAIPKAQVIRETTGLLKVIVDAETDLILGAHLFCPESHEMINLIKLAMDAKIPYQILRDAIYTHPTMSEGFNDLFDL